MIRIENLSLSLDGKVILKEIDLDSKEGDCFAILGPNGSGKTTLIEIITEYLKPTEGNVKIWDKDFSEVKERIGVLPEYPPLFYYAKVKEILFYVCCVYDTSYDRVKPLMDYLEISEIENSLVRVLSKGQRKKVGLLISLVHDPDLLILDEPTSGMDPFVREKIWELLKKKNRTIIFTTHIWEEAEKNSDRIAFINRGEILMVDTPSSFLSKRYIKSCRKLILPKRNSCSYSLDCNHVIEKEDVYCVYPSNLEEFLSKHNKLNDYSISPISLEDVFLFLAKERKGS